MEILKLHNHISCLKDIPLITNNQVKSVLSVNGFSFKPLGKGHQVDEMTAMKSKTKDAIYEINSAGFNLEKQPLHHMYYPLSIQYTCRNRLFASGQIPTRLQEFPRIRSIDITPQVTQEFKLQHVHVSQVKTR